MEQIDKMESFGQMPNLRILSIVRFLFDPSCYYRLQFYIRRNVYTTFLRNQIKKIAKLEDVAKTLEELWISYNQIKTLDELMPCENLEVSYGVLMDDFHSTSKPFHLTILTILCPGAVYWKQSN